MSAADIPQAELIAAERRAQLDLLKREAGAIVKMREVLQRAIDEEHAHRLNVCAPLFRAALSSLDRAVIEIGHEVLHGGAA